MTDAHDEREVSGPTVPENAALPTIAAVEAAERRLEGAIVRTPLIRLPLEGEDGQPVFAKPENLQRHGSFKLRGAMNFLACLDEDTRRRGVVAHSSGNHAQGVAAAARRFGVPATIVIPEGASALKVANTQALGAQVVRCANDQRSREDTANAIAVERGATLVPPYDHAWIVAGQATVGTEIAADLPDVANVLVPIGGGGLAAGVCLALAARAPEAQVVGVEPELAADAQASLRDDRRVAWTAEQVTRTMADGVRTQCIGEVNFALLRRHLAGVVTVSEARIAAATRWFVEHARLVAEPTGALALAALQRLLEEGTADGVTLRPGPTVVVISGGNVDAATLRTLLQDDAANILTS
ncbi:MAG: threonine/serine dehydratase [Trueperaceae bacterium]